jgi:hypothetical protein
MGAPGTIVEGAEKPVMRAVDVEVRREVRVVRRVRKRILVGLRVGLGMVWVEMESADGYLS